MKKWCPFCKRETARFTYGSKPCKRCWENRQFSDILPELNELFPIQDSPERVTLATDKDILDLLRAIDAGEID